MLKPYFVFCGLWSVLACCGSSFASPELHDTGRMAPYFVVVAEDRGFMANLLIEDRFAEFRLREPEAELFFVTRRELATRVKDLVSKLKTLGRQLVLLPVALSFEEQWWRRFTRQLEPLAEQAGLNLTTAPPFGDHYLAVEALKESIMKISQNPSEVEWTVLSWGATDDESLIGMTRTVKRLAETAAASLGIRSMQTVVLWNHREVNDGEERNTKLMAGFQTRKGESARQSVVPFYFGYRADSHMSTQSWIARNLEHSEILDQAPLPEENSLLSLWMSQSAARHYPLTEETLGVVILAHGADYVWNHQVMEALRPVSDRFDTVFSFNMADPELMERAVRRLEEKGKKHILVFRLMGLSSSFLNGIQAWLGEDQGMTGHSFGHHTSSVQPLLTGTHVFTRGGLEDHPLFAEALRDRALELSSGHRTRETVLLVAHGSGSDSTDAHWWHILNSLGEQIQKSLELPFASVVGVTLREDWPGKRRVALAEIGEIIETARSRGEKVLAVEARVNGPGPTSELLESWDLPINDTGLIPHPNAARIVLSEIESLLSRPDSFLEEYRGAQSDGNHGR